MVVIQLGPDTARDGREVAVVSVGDDGPGLGRLDVRRAFEPFVTTNPDGIGMGLAITEALIGDLGGELRYERTSGWTSFVIVLPMITTPAGRA